MYLTKKIENFLVVLSLISGARLAWVIPVCIFRLQISSIELGFHTLTGGEFGFCCEDLNLVRQWKSANSKT